MVKLLLIVLMPFLIFFFLFLAFGLFQTWESSRGDTAELFLAGKVPDPHLDGKFTGSANFSTGPWVGKSFDAASATGINNFEGENFRYYDAFAFKTYLGKGLQDKDLQVMKIDYDVPGNNFLVRRVMDEIVEIGPGKYLGKVHLRLIPGLPFTLLYFRLEK